MDFHRRTASPTWKPLFVVLANVASTCAIPIGSGRSCQSPSERRRKRPRADSGPIDLLRRSIEAEDDTPYFLQGSEPPPREQWEIAKPLTFPTSKVSYKYKGGPHRVSKKSADFRCENEPSGHARCCSYSNRKIRKCETLPCTLPKLKGAKVQLFQGRKQNLYSFLFTLQKLHLCTLIFLYLFFWPEIKEINHAVAPPKVVWLEPCLLQFLKFVQNCLNGPKTAKFAKNAENA